MSKLIFFVLVMSSSVTMAGDLIDFGSAIRPRHAVGGDLIDFGSAIRPRHSVSAQPVQSTINQTAEEESKSIQSKLIDLNLEF